jgi:hypothetical protein
MVLGGCTADAVERTLFRTLIPGTVTSDTGPHNDGIVVGHDAWPEGSWSSAGVIERTRRIELRDGGRMLETTTVPAMCTMFACGAGTAEIPRPMLTRMWMLQWSPRPEEDLDGPTIGHIRRLQCLVYLANKLIKLGIIHSVVLGTGPHDADRLGDSPRDFERYRMVCRQVAIWRACTAYHGPMSASHAIHWLAELNLVASDADREYVHELFRASRRCRVSARDGGDEVADGVWK